MVLKHTIFTIWFPFLLTLHVLSFQMHNFSSSTSSCLLFSLFLSSSYQSSFPKLKTISLICSQCSDSQVLPQCAASHIPHTSVMFVLSRSPSLLLSTGTPRPHYLPAQPGRTRDSAESLSLGFFSAHSDTFFLPTVEKKGP